MIDACHKRARPIILTRVAMDAGTLPMTTGTTSSWRAPVALEVIGSSITSTGLSLLIVPVLFEIVDEFNFRTRSRTGSLLPQYAQTAAAAANALAPPDQHQVQRPVTSLDADILRTQPIVPSQLST